MKKILSKRTEFLDETEEDDPEDQKVRSVFDDLKDRSLQILTPRNPANIDDNDSWHGRFITEEG